MTWLRVFRPDTETLTNSEACRRHASWYAGEGAPVVLADALKVHAEMELRRWDLDVQQAEDFVQEAWCRWFATAERLKYPARALPWLKVCIHNLAASAARRREPDPLDAPHLSVDSAPWLADERW
jgi:DNA-directed RNA polymerase specialized sigma24 family protein